MKLLISLVLIIVGMLLTIATAAAGFVGGVVIVLWGQSAEEKSDLKKAYQRRGDRSGVGLDKLPTEEPKTTVPTWAQPEASA